MLSLNKTFCEEKAARIFFYKGIVFLREKRKAIRKERW
jgi:hypothetical protein